MNFDDMATELLNFIENPLETFENKDAEHTYRLQRARIFLEMKFGHVDALQKEAEVLRREKETMMLIVTSWSERQKSPDENQF